MCGVGLIDVASAARGAFTRIPVFAEAMRDPWRDAMLDGAFERAWAISDEILRRRASLACAHLPFHLRWVWNGSPLGGRRVLVRCYHGLGDTLQFIRFVPRIAAVAREVVVEAQPELLPLIRAVYPLAEWLPLGAEMPAYDLDVELMEVPHALRLALADLPGRIPYLAVPSSPPSLDFDAKTSAGPPRIARSRHALRIGLVWAGGDWRRERSVPPHCLLPLFELPVDFVGLQLGAARCTAEAALLTAELAGMIPEDIPIAGTAAVMQQLDLVITIDSMTAHLAGALGLPVWTMLDAEADWRWMRHRSDSPWYPTMRLFRQPRPGAWDPVIADMKSALARLLRRSPERASASLR